MDPNNLVLRISSQWFGWLPGALLIWLSRDMQFRRDIEMPLINQLMVIFGNSLSVVAVVSNLTADSIRNCVQTP